MMAAGFLWPAVRRTVRIEVAKPALWDLLAAPGHLERCHPYCRTHRVDRWAGDDRRDSIHYFSGLVYYRQFTSWHIGDGFDLDIGTSKTRLSHVRWRLAEAENEAACRLSIVIFTFRRHASVSAQWSYVTKHRPRIVSYLTAVTKGIKYTAETGLAVHRNQFGAHPTYSPATT